jgi:hypothetical protein
MFETGGSGMVVEGLLVQIIEKENPVMIRNTKPKSSSFLLFLQSVWKA